jgi:hypothetical protein
MAGMYYVVIVLLFGLFGLAAATITSITLVIRAKKRLPTDSKRRLLFLTTCGAAPFVGFIWLIVSTVVHIEISNKLAHQDCGFSGDPYVTLPNGFVVGSLNTYSGYIVAPGYNTDLPATGPGYVRSLIDIELKDRIFVGAYRDYDTNTVHNFTLNTGDRSIHTSDTGIPIDFETVQDRVHQDPTSYWKLYDKYRHHWPVFVSLNFFAFGQLAIIFASRKFWNRMPLRST